MNTKLTLSIDEATIAAAKDLAQSQGQSLSHLVENYLRALSNKGSGNQNILPQVRQLRGSVPVPPDFDYKKELEKALAEKYLM